LYPHLVCLFSPLPTILKGRFTQLRTSPKIELDSPCRCRVTFTSFHVALPLYSPPICPCAQPPSDYFDPFTSFFRFFAFFAFFIFVSRLSGFFLLPPPIFYTFFSLLRLPYHSKIVHSQGISVSKGTWNRTVVVIPFLLAPHSNLSLRFFEYNDRSSYTFESLIILCSPTPTLYPQPYCPHSQESEGILPSFFHYVFNFQWTEE